MSSLKNGLKTMLNNTQARYGLIAKGFHWLMALAIIGMLALGLYMEDLPLGPAKLEWYGLHKSVGAALLLAVLLRFAWRQANRVPPLPADLSAAERYGAKLAHFGLYGLMLAMPLTGWLMSSAAGFPVSVFGWFMLPDLLAPDKALADRFKEAHEWLAFALIGLALLHALAALYHHVIRRDDVLKRMLPW